MTNPVITNNDVAGIFTFANDFRDITLSAAGAVTYPEGQVLAFNASTGKWDITKSGTAAIANAKAVLAEEAAFTGAGDKLVRACVKGEVDEDLLIFDGSDTIDTIPAGAADSFRVQLRDYMIIARKYAQQLRQDNQ